MTVATQGQLQQRTTTATSKLRRPPSDQLSPPQSDQSDDDVEHQEQLRSSKKTISGKRYNSLEDDEDLPDDYVTRTLAREPPLPPVQLKNLLSEIQWVSFLVLTSTPILAIYGICTTHLQLKTFLWASVYAFSTALGITAGYHRLWAHRSYIATRPLEYALALLGSGAVQGSIHWWARGHRAHHRYTDTDLDPYGAHFGLLWSHLGWMIVKPRRRPGVADISDLRKNPVIKFQHKFYLPLLFIMGFGFPTAVAGLGWGDWRGGFFFAAVTRLVFVHHSTFCVNSLAHYLGDATFDNKMTPRDHFITALVTVGEGYHNFHHQFPMDYRNAIQWFQYDPTKWSILLWSYLGLASHLKTFPSNEIKKGRIAMKLQKLHAEQAALSWPKHSNDLPVLSYEDFREEAASRPLCILHGFVLDVSGFMDSHPGGRALLSSRIGKDISTAFVGGVYDHSRSAHSLAAQMRVGVLDGGYVPPSCKMDKVENTPAVPAPTPATDERDVCKAATQYCTPGEAYVVVRKSNLEANVRDANGRVGKW